MGKVAVFAILSSLLLGDAIVMADPSRQERHYRRSNGWNWNQDTTNKSTPSCMDKYGHEAGKAFVAYLGSIDEFIIGDRTIKISAGANVPAVEGKRDFKQSGESYWILPQPWFFGKDKPTFGGFPVSQLVSHEVMSNLTSLTITVLALDGNTVKCDDIFWTILDVTTGR